MENKEIFDTNARKAINDLISNQTVLTDKVNQLTEIVNAKSVPAPVVAPAPVVPAPAPAVPAPVVAPAPVTPAPATPPAEPAQ